jgi:hypothetical protein
VEHVGPIVKSSNGDDRVCIENREMQIVVDGDVARRVWRWHLLREKLEDALVDHHPSVSAQWHPEYHKVESVNIAMDYLEKDQIRWWSLTDLKNVMEQKGTLGQDRFRPYFLPVLQTFLNKCTALTAIGLAPPNELSEQLPSTTANSSEASAPPVPGLQ